MPSSKKKRSGAKKKSAAKAASKKKSSARKTTASRGSQTKKKTAKKAKSAPRKKSTVKKAAAAGTKKKSAAKTKTPQKKSTAKKTSTNKKKTSTASKSAGDTKKKTSTAKKSTASKAAASSPSTKTKKKSTSKKTLGKSKQAAVQEPPKPDANGYMVINGRRVRVIATKEGTVKKKPKPVVATPDVEAEKQRLKSIKTSLSKKELTHFRTLLLMKRAELVGDLNSIETEALRSNDGDISHMPIHMADVGSDTYEQDFMLGLAENDRKLLREIDEALQRIEDRTFGVCQLTGNMIGAARLEAKPWAKYSIEAKRLLESGQAS